MEYFPLPPAENPKKPDQTGELEASKKKKKKTTRIPLPVKPEPQKILPEKLEKQKSSELFSKEEKEDEEKPESVLSTDYDPINKPEVTGIPEVEESEATEKSIVRPELTGTIMAEEFADEAPIIISRGSESNQPPSETEAEKNKAETIPALVLPEVAKEVTTQETAPIEAGEVLNATPSEDIEAVSVTEETVVTHEAMTETVPELVPGEVVDSVLHPEEPAPEHAPPLITEAPSRGDMIDPSRLEAEAVYQSTVPMSAESNQPSYSNEDLRRAEKRGLRRGVVSGAFAAWWLGRRKRRTMERDAEVALRQRDRKIAQLESAQATVQTQETPQAPQPREIVTKQPAPENQSFTPTLETQRTKERGELRTAVAVEKVSVESLQKTPPHELPPEERPVTEETYQAPEGRRVETSVWHRYEVDAKTGRLAEEQTLEYGEEFSREVRQEKLQRDAVEPQVAVQVGQAVLQDDSLGAAQTPSIPTIPASQAEQKTSFSDRLMKYPVTKQLMNYTTRPLTWITALIIVVLLFLVGILN